MSSERALDRRAALSGPVADLSGTIFDVDLSANAGHDWIVAETSTGSGPTTYIAGIHRDSDVRVVMQRRDDPSVRVVIVFRVTETLAVSELHLE